MSANEHAAGRVSLADTPDFELGGARVQPSRCRVAVAAREEHVEPRVMQVLVFLAAAEGRTVTRDALIAACWDGRIVTDDAVTRTLAKLRTLARAFEPPPFRVETVAKVGFRLVAEGGASARTATTTAPVPPPSYGPPASPSTSAPSRDEAEPSPAIASDVSPPSRTPEPRRALLAAVVAVATIAVLVTWLARPRPLDAGPTPAPAEGRVEVHTFEALQNDPTLQRFGTRIADATAQSLRAGGIETARRPATREAAGSPAAAEFRIAGTIDRDADRYVATAQIVASGSGDVLWADRFDRAVADPTGFPEQTANHVADVLHCALGSRAMSRGPMSPQTFALFLGACDVRRPRRPQDAAVFVEVSRRLVDHAPEMSVAHSMYAIAAATASNYLDPADSERFVQLTKAEAARALELDPANGEAYFALGIAGTDRAERERNLLRAAELSPKLSVVRNFHVELLREVGRTREAQALNVTSAARDPFSPTQLRNLAVGYGAIGDIDQVGPVIQQLALINAESAREAQLTITLWWEPPTVALGKLRELGRGTLTDADLTCFEDYLARLTRAAGRPLKGLPDSCASAYSVGKVRMLARQGDLDGAYALFDARTVDEANLRWLYYPEMAAFLRDPRFPALARRLGLADYWRTTKKWPDFCAEPGVAYDCENAFAERSS